MAKDPLVLIAVLRWILLRLLRSPHGVEKPITCVSMMYAAISKTVGTP
jgi:hypothetical protein